MKTRKLMRIAGVAGLVLLALGAIGYAAEGGATNVMVDVPGDAYAGDDDVMASIDLALGRQPDVRPGAPDMPTNAAPLLADASKESAQRSAASNAVAPVAAGASTGAGGVPGVEPMTTSTVDDRKIVQTASMRLQVKEVGGSFEEVSRIATGAGGFVASSNFALQGDQNIASMTIRVPATRYQEVLNEVRRLGSKVEAETSNASDVTEEYSDLEARLRNLEVTETRYVELLARAASISDVLQVQDRLNSTRTQIDQVKGRQALLDKLSDLATITVHLRPVVSGSTSSGGGVDLGAKVEEAWDDSLQFLGNIAGGVLTVVVFGWWLPLVAVPAYIVLRRWSGSRAPAAGAVD